MDTEQKRRPVLDPRLYEPVNVEFEEATPEQIARALFAAAEPPDPKRRRREKQAATVA